MLAKEQLQEVLATAKNYGADFAEIFVEKKLNTGISLEDNNLERIITGTDIGAGIRVIVGNNTSYAYTNDLSRNSLLEAAELVAKAAGMSKKSCSINLSRKYLDKSVEIIKPPDFITVGKKAETVTAANTAARKVDSRIKQVIVGYGDVIQKVQIANSLGEMIDDRRVRTRLIVHAIAVDNSLIQTGYEAVGDFAGFEIFDSINIEELAKRASKRAVSMLTARPAPSGRMPVIITAEAGGTMIHEACGHGLEADLVQKKLSVYAGKIGEKVASSNVTVIDDGTLNKYGYIGWDDEGTKGQKNVLIQKGILQGFMYDRLTAMKENKKSTGNGRRESYKHKPIPRMTNTYIDKGYNNPEEIIKNTQTGLLVKRMGGGQVNTTNGDFVFEVAEGYLIKNGQIEDAVRGATLTGNGPEVLMQIDMVGNDLGFTIGTCGKDGQGVPVSDAQPTIRINELIVGGTETSA